MDIREEASAALGAALGAAQLEEQRQPLLEDQEKKPGEKAKKNPTQKAIRKSFKMSAHLANLLPTGSVLAFQILSPVFTHQGKCKSPITQSLTLALLGLCGLSCFLVSFTDSFRDERGKVHHGMATYHGIWILDGSITIPHEEVAKYKIEFIDFLHAFLSFFVFIAVALFDQNVVRCFYPNPSEEAEELLHTLPIGVGVICSLLFVAFPTKRHGIGFPLSRN